MKSILTLPPRIPLFAGRPRRDSVLEKDEILNLRIALHTTTDVLDFLNSLPHGNPFLESKHF